MHWKLSTAVPKHDRGGIFVTDAVEHAALIRALSNDLEAAARLAGYSEAAFQRLGYQREYTERVTRTRLDSLLERKALPAHQRDSLLSAGAWLTPERAVALSIASLTAIPHIPRSKSDEGSPGCITRTSRPLRSSRRGKLRTTQ